VSPPEPHPTAHDEAAVWLLRLRAQGDAGTRAALEAWLAADPGHAAAFDAVCSAWSLFGDQAAAPELLAMRRDALSRAHRAGGARWAGPQIGRRSLAAGIAAVVAAPLGALWWFSARSSSGLAYRTGLGEQRTVTLEDGSRLSLDAHTVLKVAYSRDLRLIELATGRAHFEVAKDPARPMKVRAGAKTITALGTAFTVERQAEHVVVTLVEGRVAVSDDGAAPTEMRPQQQLVLAPNTPPVLHQEVDVDRAMAWREGKLVFDDETLAGAAARMNNYSPLKVVVEGDAVRNLRISGIFKAGDTPAFVEAVKAYFPVDAQTSDATVVIRPAS